MLHVGGDPAQGEQLPDSVFFVEGLPRPLVLPDPLPELRHEHGDHVGLGIAVERRPQDGGGEAEELGVLQRRVLSRNHRHPTQLRALLGAVEQRRELRREVDHRSGIRGLHAPFVDMVHQVSNQLLPRLDQFGIGGGERKIAIPILGNVSEKGPPDGVRSDGIVVAVPEMGRTALNSLVLPVQVGLPSEGIDVDPGELHLGQLIDQRPEVGDAPSLHAGHQILDGGVGANPEDRLHDRVQLRKLERLLRRQDVAVDEVPDTPALGQLVDRPQGGAGTSAADHKRRPAFEVDGPQHQALIGQFGKRAGWKRLAEKGVGLRRAQKENRFGGGGRFGDRADPNVEELFQVTAKLAGRELLQLGSRRPDHDTHRRGGRLGATRQEAR